jgi:uncharacterized protein (TIGR02145 family)
MRKLLVPLLTILLFITCKKHDPETKIQVCHRDQKEGASHTITISANELPAHLAHGDLLGACPIAKITICDQTWMVKNLDVDHYRNGDPIPQVTDETEWRNLTTGAWCWYRNDSTRYSATYGKLYNWYAVNDPRGLAPEGWHVPSDADWTTLITCLGGNEVAGGKMKSVGTIEDGTGLWLAPNTDATNSSGFTGLPGGYRVGSIYVQYTDFDHIAINGLWWVSTGQPDGADFVELDNNTGSIFRNDPSIFKTYGFSVRCLRD